VNPGEVVRVDSRRPVGPGRLVMVKWEDITNDAEWSDEWSPDMETAVCYSVGWISRELPDRIVLVSSLCSPDTPDRVSGGKEAIPKGCILEVVEL